MFVNDRLLFVELHKTGCTHIGKWLDRLIGGQQIGKHNRVPAALRDRFVIGSVRNPWDWYVSLWAFGCNGEGAVFRHTTRHWPFAYFRGELASEMELSLGKLGFQIRQTWADLRRPAREWRDVYQGSENVPAFRRWLKMIMDPKRRLDMGEGYGFSPVASWAGLMSFRYLKLFSALDEKLYRDPDLATLAGASRAWRRTRFVRFIIRNEQLEEDLLAALSRAGFNLSMEQQDALLAGRECKTNSSNRMATELYYDSECIELVAAREALIIGEHGYTPPVINQ